MKRKMKGVKQGKLDEGRKGEKGGKGKGVRVMQIEEYANDRTVEETAEYVQRIYILKRRTWKKEDKDGGVFVFSNRDAIHPTSIYE